MNEDEGFVVISMGPTGPPIDPDGPHCGDPDCNCPSENDLRLLVANLPPREQISLEVRRTWLGQRLAVAKGKRRYRASQRRLKRLG